MIGPPGHWQSWAVLNQRHFVKVSWLVLPDEIGKDLPVALQKQKTRIEVAIMANKASTNIQYRIHSSLT